MINFNINVQKAVESVLWIISQGEDNIYNIMKILFEADKYSLNNYACPVTGDKYIIMKYGTVPDWVYKSLNLKGFDYLKEGNKLIAKRKADLNLLSESDIESLEVGLKKYKGKSFNEVMDINHEEACYKNNCSSGINKVIPFEDMINDDNPNKQVIIADLSETAEFMVV